MSAEVIPFPPVHQRHWSWPGWPENLYQDGEDGGRYRYDGELDRQTFDRCVRAVGGDGPALLSELVEDGTLDLTQPSFAGAVASVWAASRHSPSALTIDRWVELFWSQSSTYTVDFRPAARPAEPVRLYRGCVPLVRYFGNGMRLVETDDYGQPVNPAEVAEVRDTRIDMAWTSNLRTARSHARNCLPGRAGEVFVTTVAPEFLLAQIRNDYVVDPRGLTDLSYMSNLSVAAVRR